MCAIDVCRICLKRNIKLYSLAEFNLKKYYEELHGESINVNDGLPCCFCYQCAALLHKFHKFKEKSNYSQTKLKNLLRTGPITVKSINNIISTNENVYKCGTLQILTMTDDMMKAFREVNDDIINDVIDIKVEVVEQDSDDIKTYEDPENDSIAESEIHKHILIKEETTEITEFGSTPHNIVDSLNVEVKSEVHLELKRKLGQEEENVSSEKDEEYEEVKPKRRQNQKEDEEWVPKKKLRNRPEINKCNLKSKESKFKEKVCLQHSEESCSDSDEFILLPPKKICSQNKAWKIVNKFENLENAYNFVKSENTWSFLANKHTAKGLKKYFRCNKIKRNGPQCSAQVYILGDSSSDEVLLFRTESDHDHSSLKLSSHSSHGLSDQVKEEINKLHDLRLKPKAILENLAKINSITVPKMTQLRTYLKTRRLNKYEPTISLSELDAWLTAHSTVPDNNHEVYVIGHEIIDGFESPHFRFVLSTKFLLQKASGVNNIHADATYKLIWQGFSVVIVGSTDKNRKFHPFALAVLTREEKNDFKLLFGSIKDNIMTLFSQGFQPKVLVCGGTKAIQNAFTEVFGEDVIIRMCWAQAKNKIQEQIEKNTRKEVHKELLADVDTLQAATDTDTFNSASKLFLKKWEKEATFVKYFEEQWLTQNRHWYLGVHMGSPATNKALESHNRAIKHECIVRERLPLSRFLTVASELVKRWSSNDTEGTAENKMFATTPTLNLINWKESYQWAKLPIEVKLTHKDEFYRYYEVPAGNTNDFRHFENSWADFNEYKTQFFRKWKVALPCNMNWMNGKCNCPNFYKEYTCKHILGLAIRLKIVIPPAVITQKGQRGRPKLRPALIVH